MSRAVSVLVLVLAGLATACGATQDPTVIKIESSETTPSTDVIPSPGVAPSESTSAKDSDAMGAEGAPMESEAPTDKAEAPIEKKDETAPPAKTPEAPKTGTTAPVPQPYLTFKLGRDGGFDNTAATFGTWLGERSLICRVKSTTGALVTGSMIPSTGACFFDNNGEGYYATSYEYMAINAASTEKVRWSFVGNMAIPAGAIATGTTNAGKPTYACRVDFTDGDSIVGHVAPGYSGCYYSIDADVYAAASFYVLVK